MHQIFKNYLKTFIQNWIQTIGTILFIVMMCAIVIGMLASPLQISSKIKTFDRNNIKFDNYVASPNAGYNSDFLYTYVYEGKDYEVKNEKNENIDVIDQMYNDGIISNIYKKSINDEIQNINFKNEYEKKEFIGNIIIKGLGSFRNGALVQTNSYLELTNGNANMNSDNLNLLVDDLMSKLEFDINLSKELGYNVKESIMRAFTKVSTLFKDNGLNIDLTSILDEFISNPIQILKDQIINQLEGKVINKKLYLLSFQVLTNNMYKTLSDKTFSYDFKNFVTFSALKNINNIKAYNKITNKFNFTSSFEKSYYFSKTTTESLFPSFAVEFKTIDNEFDVNQLQLESGRRVETTSLKDIKNDKKTPEIILSSSYMDKNNLNIGDLIEIPEGPEHNNVITQSSPIDSKLTSKLTFKIVGSGAKFDDAVPGKRYIPFLEDIKDYTFAYVDNDVFQYIRNARWSYSSNYDNTYSSMVRTKNNTNDINIEDVFTGNEQRSVGVFGTGKGQFLKASSSSTNLSLNNLRIQVIVYIILGVAVLILAFIFINFTIKKELNETRKQIGIFKSFGYKISELSWIFAIKTFITILGGMILGYIGSIPLQMYSASNYDSSVMFHFQHIYGNPGFIIIILLVIPILFLAISYLLTILYLKEPTLSLLSNGAKLSKIKLKPSLLIRYLSKHNKAFNYRLQRSFVRTGLGKFIVVQTLFAFSSLTFTLMFGAQTLMYSMVNQGFSILKDDFDHTFKWENQNELNIDYEKTKYNIKNLDEYLERDFEYKSYDSKKDLAEVLVDSATTSDSRYRIDYIISSISSEFDVDKNKALDLLMPIEFYKDKFGEGNDNGIEVDPEIGPQKMIYRDYYLNWLFTFKINSLTENEVDEVRNNEKLNLTNLQNFVNNNPDSRIDLTELINGNVHDVDMDDLQKEFMNTLFGIGDSNEKGQKNNLFMSDISKIISLQLMEGYVDSKLENELIKNYKPSSDGKYKNSEIISAMQKVREDRLVKDFSPNKEKYWGIGNNPLVNEKEVVDSNGNSPSEKPSKGNGGISLSKLSPETVSLIMSAMMLGKNSDDINEMPVMTINQLFFNKEKEMLAYEMPVLGVDDDQATGSFLKLINSKEAGYGDFNELFNHNGIKDEIYNEKLGEINSENNTVNAVIPYGLAKAYDINLNDKMTIYSDTKNKEKIILNIVGINKNISFTLGLGWPIDVDYNAFRTKFFDSSLNEIINNTSPIFNSMYSKESMLVGNVNLNDLSGSINSMKYVGRNLSLSINKGSSIFGSIFNGIIDFTKLFNLKIDSTTRLITNPNIASSSNSSTVTPYNIMRVGVNDTVDRVNNVLVLFMVLQTVLLLIILVVVMNIIVEESTGIILTLRSLGYRNRDINWIVMGSYIIGAIGSFIIAYLLSLLIWAIFLQVAGELWHIYVFMSFSWKAPVITFLVIFSILFIGWFVSNWKVNKTPLTLVTGFN